MVLECGICRSQGQHWNFLARDITFGSTTEYGYFECSACGCIQMRDIPPDLGAFYPDEYYAFQQRCAPCVSGPSYELKCRRTRHVLHGDDIVGWLTARLFGVPDYLKWFARMKLSEDARVLDVGCGNGKLLATFRSWGFTKLQGIDPFIQQDITLDGINIRKQALDTVQDTFDVLIFNHSWEHIPDQHRLMADARRLLEPSGWIVVRIPVAGTHAWRTYGTDWHAFEAPRHLYLHTERSLELLGREHGFSVRETIFDSTARQFWGSEQNRLGISMYSPQSLRNNPRATNFNRKQLRQWAVAARRLNEAHQGDCAAFLLQCCDA